MVQNNTKIFSSKQEKMVAKVLGGYPVGGSGASPGIPGDVRVCDWLVECKTHMEPGHSIFFDLSVWQKIQKEAMGVHKKPALVVDDGSQKEDNTWCLCKRDDINFSKVITVEWPASIRKNITASNTKLKDVLKKETKRYLGEFYEAGAYEIHWDNDTVAVLPLQTFKELFTK